MQEVSRGIDRLVALASLGAEWREKVLSDPLAAARKAGLDLSEGERAVIASVPRAALAGMIASFEKAVPRPSGLGRLAAGAAAAALLAGSLISLEGCGATDGHRPDEPPKKPGKIEPAPPATDGIRPDVPPSKPRKAEPVRPKPPDSDKVLSKGGGRKKVIFRSGGHRADVPAPKKKPEQTDSEESAK